MATPTHVELLLAAFSKLAMLGIYNDGILTISSGFSVVEAHLNRDVTFDGMDAAVPGDVHAMWNGERMRRFDLAITPALKVCWFAPTFDVEDEERRFHDTTHCHVCEGEKVNPDTADDLTLVCQCE